MNNFNYEVKFDKAFFERWFWTRVYYLENDDKKLIAEKPGCKNHFRAAKWANKQINNHKKAKRILSGALK